MDKNAQDHRSEDLLSLGAAQEEQGANQDSAATSTEPALPSPGVPSQDSGSSNVGKLLNAELALHAFSPAFSLNSNSSSKSSW